MPALEECEPLGLVEVGEQFLADGDRPGLVADQLAHLAHGRLAVHIRAERIEIGLIGDDVLAALRQEIIEEQLGRVRVLRLVGDERDARGHQRIVLRHDDAEARDLLGAGKCVGTEHAVGDGMLARGHALDHRSGRRVEPVSYTHLDVYKRQERIEIGLIGDDVLAALRQEIIEEQLGRVRVLRLVGDERDARGHQRIVLRHDDAEARDLLGAGKCVGTEHAVGDGMLARGHALDHRSGRRVEPVSYTHLDVYKRQERIEIGLIGDDVLAALRQEIIEEQLGRVRVLRLVGDERDARGHQRIVLRHDDAEARDLLGAGKCVGTEHAVGDGMLARGHALDHRSGRRVEPVSYTHLDVYKRQERIEIGLIGDDVLAALRQEIIEEQLGRVRVLRLVGDERDARGHQRIVLRHDDAEARDLLGAGKCVGTEHAVGDGMLARGHALDHRSGRRVEPVSYTHLDVYKRQERIEIGLIGDDVLAALRQEIIEEQLGRVRVLRLVGDERDARGHQRIVLRHDDAEARDLLGAGKCVGTEHAVGDGMLARGHALDHRSGRRVEPVSYTHLDVYKRQERIEIGLIGDDVLAALRQEIIEEQLGRVRVLRLVGDERDARGHQRIVLRHDDAEARDLLGAGKCVGTEHAVGDGMLARGHALDHRSGRRVEPVSYTHLDVYKRQERIEIGLIGDDVLAALRQEIIEEQLGRVRVLRLVGDERDARGHQRIVLRHDDAEARDLLGAGKCVGTEHAVGDGMLARGHALDHRSGRRVEPVSYTHLDVYKRQERIEIGLIGDDVLAALRQEIIEEQLGRVRVLRLVGDERDARGHQRIVLRHDDAEARDLLGAGKCVGTEHAVGDGMLARGHALDHRSGRRVEPVSYTHLDVYKRQERIEIGLIGDDVLAALRQEIIEEQLGRVRVLRLVGDERDARGHQRIVLRHDDAEARDLLGAGKCVGTEHAVGDGMLARGHALDHRSGRRVEPVSYTHLDVYKRQERIEIGLIGDDVLAALRQEIIEEQLGRVRVLRLVGDERDARGHQRIVLRHDDAEARDLLGAGKCVGTEHAVGDGMLARGHALDHRSGRRVEPVSYTHLDVYKRQERIEIGLIGDDVLAALRQEIIEEQLGRVRVLRLVGDERDARGHQRIVLRHDDAEARDLLGAGKCVGTEHAVGDGMLARGHALDHRSGRRVEPVSYTHLDVYKRQERIEIGLIGDDVLAALRQEIIEEQLGRVRVLRLVGDERDARGHQRIVLRHDDAEARDLLGAGKCVGTEHAVGDGMLARGHALDHRSGRRVEPVSYTHLDVYKRQERIEIGLIGDDVLAALRQEIIEEQLGRVRVLRLVGDERDARGHQRIVLRHDDAEARDLLGAGKCVGTEHAVGDGMLARGHALDHRSGRRVEPVSYTHLDVYKRQERIEIGLIGDDVLAALRQEIIEEQLGRVRVLRLVGDERDARGHQRIVLRHDDAEARDLLGAGKCVGTEHAVGDGMLARGHALDHRSGRRVEPVSYTHLDVYKRQERIEIGLIGDDVLAALRQEIIEEQLGRVRVLRLVGDERDARGHQRIVLRHDDAEARDLLGAGKCVGTEHAVGDGMLARGHALDHRSGRRVEPVSYTHLDVYKRQERIEIGLIGDDVLAALRQEIIEEQLGRVRVLRLVGDERDARGHQRIVLRHDDAEARDLLGAGKCVGTEHAVGDGMLARGHALDHRSGRRVEPVSYTHLDVYKRQERIEIGLIGDDVLAALRQEIIEEQLGRVRVLRLVGDERDARGHQRIVLRHDDAEARDLLGAGKCVGTEHAVGDGMLARGHALDHRSGRRVEPVSYTHLDVYKRQERIEIGLIGDDVLAALRQEIIEEQLGRVRVLRLVGDERDARGHQRIVLRHDDAEARDLLGAGKCVGTEHAVGDGMLARGHALDHRSGRRVEPVSYTHLDVYKRQERIEIGLIGDDVLAALRQEIIEEQLGRVRVLRLVGDERDARGHQRIVLRHDDAEARDLLGAGKCVGTEHAVGDGMLARGHALDHRSGRRVEPVSYTHLDVYKRQERIEIGLIGDDVLAALRQEIIEEQLGRVRVLRLVGDERDARGHQRIVLRHDDAEARDLLGAGKCVGTEHAVGDGMLARGHALDHRSGRRVEPVSYTHLDVYKRQERIEIGLIGDDVLAALRQEIIEEQLGRVRVLRLVGDERDARGHQRIVLRHDDAEARDLLGAGKCVGTEHAVGDGMLARGHALDHRSGRRVEPVSYTHLDVYKRQERIEIGLIGDDVLAALRQEIIEEQLGRVRVLRLVGDERDARGHQRIVLRHDDAEARDLLGAGKCVGTEHAVGDGMLARGHALDHRSGRRVEPVSYTHLDVYKRQERIEIGLIGDDVLAALRQEIIEEQLGRVRVLRLVGDERDARGHQRIVLRHDDAEARDLLGAGKCVGTEHAVGDGMLARGHALDHRSGRRVEPVSYTHLDVYKRQERIEIGLIGDDVLAALRQEIIEEQLGRVRVLRLVGDERDARGHQRIVLRHDDAEARDLLGAGKCVGTEHAVGDGMLARGHALDHRSGRRVEPVSYTHLDVYKRQERIEIGLIGDDVLAALRQEIIEEQLGRVRVLRLVGDERDARGHQRIVLRHDDAEARDLLGAGKCVGTEHAVGDGMLARGHALDHRSGRRVEPVSYTHLDVYKRQERIEIGLIGDDVLAALRQEIIEEQLGRVRVLRLVGDERDARGHQRIVLRHDDAEARDLLGAGKCVGTEHAVGDGMLARGHALDHRSGRRVEPVSYTHLDVYKRQERIEIGLIGDDVLAALRQEIIEEQLGRVRVLRLVGDERDARGHQRIVLRHDDAEARDLLGAGKCVGTEHAVGDGMLARGHALDHRSGRRVEPVSYTHLDVYKRQERIEIGLIGDDVLAALRQEIIEEQLGRVRVLRLVGDERDARGHQRIVLRHDDAEARDLLGAGKCVGTEHAVGDGMLARGHALDHRSGRRVEPVSYTHLDVYKRQERIEIGLIGDDVLAALRQEIIEEQLGRVRVLRLVGDERDARGHQRIVLRHDDAEARDLLGAGKCVGTEHAVGDGMLARGHALDHRSGRRVEPVSYTHLDVYKRQERIEIGLIGDDVLAALRQEIIEEQLGRVRVLRLVGDERDARGHQRIVLRHDDAEARDLLGAGKCVGTEHAVGDGMLARGHALDHRSGRRVEPVSYTHLDVYKRQERIEIGLIGDDVLAALRQEIIEEQLGRVRVLRLVGDERDARGHQRIVLRHDDAEARDLLGAGKCVGTEHAVGDGMLARGHALDHRSGRRVEPVSYTHLDVYKRQERIEIGLIGDDVLAALRQEIIEEQLGRVRVLRLVGDERDARGHQRIVLRHDDAEARDLLGAGKCVGTEHAVGDGMLARGHALDHRSGRRVEPVSYTHLDVYKRQERIEIGLIGDDVLAALRQEIIEEQLGRVRVLRLVGDERDARGHQRIVLRHDDAEARDLLGAGKCVGTEHAVGDGMLARGHALDHRSGRRVEPVSYTHLDVYKRQERIEIGLIGDDVLAALRQEIIEEQLGRVRVLRLVGDERDARGHQRIVLRHDDAEARDLLGAGKCVGTEHAVGDGMLARGHALDHRSGRRVEPVSYTHLDVYKRQERIEIGLIGDDVLAALRQEIIEEQLGRVRVLRLVGDERDARGHQRIVLRHDDAEARDLLGAGKCVGTEHAVGDGMLARGHALDHRSGRRVEPVSYTHLDVYKRQERIEIGLIGDDVLAALRQEIIEEQLGRVRVLRLVGDERDARGHQRIVLRHDDAEARDLLGAGKCVGTEHAVGDGMLARGHALDHRSGRRVEPVSYTHLDVYKRQERIEIGLIGDDVLAALRQEIIEEQLGRVRVLRLVGDERDARGHQRIVLRHDDAEARDLLGAGKCVGTEHAVGDGMLARGHALDHRSGRRVEPVSYTHLDVYKRQERIEIGLIGDDVLAALRQEIIEEQLGRVRVLRLVGDERDARGHQRIVLRHDDAEARDLLGAGKCVGTEHAVGDGMLARGHALDHRSGRRVEPVSYTHLDVYKRQERIEIGLIGDDVLAALRQEIIEEQLGRVRVLRLVGDERDARGHQRIVLRHDDAEARDLLGAGKCVGTEHAVGDGMLARGHALDHRSGRRVEPVSYTHLDVYKRQERIEIGLIGDDVLAALRQEIIEEQLGRVRVLRLVGDERDARGHQRIVLRHDDAEARDLLGAGKCVGTEHAVGDGMLARGHALDHRSGRRVEPVSYTHLDVYKRQERIEIGLIGDDVLAALRQEIIEEQLGRVRVLRLVGDERDARGHQRIVLRHDDAEARDLLGAGKCVGTEHAVGDGMLARGHALDHRSGRRVEPVSYTHLDVYKRQERIEIGLIGDDVLAALRQEIIEEQLGRVRVLRLVGDERDARGHQRIVLRHDDAEARDLLGAGKCVGTEHAVGDGMLARGHALDHRSGRRVEPVSYTHLDVYKRQERIEIGLIGDDVLAALRQEIIEEQLGRVRVLRLVGDERDARGHQRIVLRHDDAEARDLLGAGKCVGTEHAVGDGMLARGHALDHRSGRRVEPVSYTHLDVYKRQERIEIGLIGDDVLAALRQEIIEEQLGRVRVLRLVGDERDARGHQRIVLRHDDAEARDLLGAGKCVGTEHAVGDGMLARGHALDHRSGRRVEPVSYTHLDVYKRQERIEIGLIGDDVLAALRQEIIEEQLGRVRVLRLVGDERDARGHQRIVLRHDDAEARDLLGAGKCVGTEHAVGDGMLARGHALDHRSGRRVELDRGLAEGAEQVPGLRQVFDVLVDEEIADAGFLRVIGRDLALVGIGLAVEQRQQRGMVLRHIAGRHQALVVDEGDGLIGRAIGLVAPHRPFRQRRDLRRGIRRGVPVGRELDLQVHGRRP